MHPEDLAGVSRVGDVFQDATSGSSGADAALPPGVLFLVFKLVQTPPGEDLTELLRKESPTPLLQLPDTLWPELGTLLLSPGSRAQA